MPDALLQLGFWGVFAGMTAIIFGRSQATYWIARAAVTGAGRHPAGRRLGRRMVRARELLNRYGPPVVTVSFLTIGFKTAMNAAAGASRMPWLVYTLAMLPGCVLYGLIYATVGLAALWSALASPWGAAAVLAVIGAVVAYFVWQNRREARAERETEPAERP